MFTLIVRLHGAVVTPLRLVFSNCGLDQTFPFVNNGFCLHANWITTLSITIHSFSNACLLQSDHHNARNYSELQQTNFPHLTYRLRTWLCNLGPAGQTLHTKAEQVARGSSAKVLKSFIRNF